MLQPCKQGTGAKLIIILSVAQLAASVSPGLVSKTSISLRAGTNCHLSIAICGTASPSDLLARSNLRDYLFHLASCLSYLSPVHEPVLMPILWPIPSFDQASSSLICISTIHLQFVVPPVFEG